MNIDLYLYNDTFFFVGALNAFQKLFLHSLIVGATRPLFRKRKRISFLNAKNFKEFKGLGQRSL